MSAEIKTAIGLMSGTSMDGIDVALLKTDGEAALEFGPTMAVDYDAAFRKRLADALDDAMGLTSATRRSAYLVEIEREVTDRHARAVNRFVADNRLAGGIDLIGFHGQTVLHRPDLGFTVQVGDGQRLADATGIAVVHDLRANDMRHGGQGAPLVPVFHQALARTLDAPLRERGVAFVNIGGISNATFVFEGHDPVALDCGPGNALIDQWMSREAGIPMDEGGRIAGEGAADNAVVAAYLDHPFFRLTGPKSLDRNDFTLDLMPPMDLSDGAATLAKVTAQAIAVSVEAMPTRPGTVLLSGGGARNRALVDYAAKALPDVDVTTSDGFGISADMMEAQCWAYLAVRSLRGLPISFPTTTGVSKPVSGGVLSMPRKE